jgi:ribonuclease HI
VKRCDQTEVELFAVIARKIWLRRNQVVHGGSFSHPNQVLREAVSILEDFRLSNANCNMPQPSSPPTHVEKWRPPPMNFVKINWDAAVDISKKIIGMGIIARDEKGRFLAAISKKQKIMVEPVVAETIAAINAIIFCQELNYRNVIFEGDALQVVREVNSDRMCSNHYGHLVEDVKLGLRQLNSAKFTHVRRSANGAAHELALVARTHVIDVVRWNLLPPNINGIVQREESHSTS